MNEKQTRSQRAVIVVSTLVAAVFCVSAAHAATVTKVARRIDGAYVAPAEKNVWPVAVMIDNHPAARPQAGLSQASIVYETLAEGGIPRFMAVFASGTKLPLIGPVRSTRPYFVRYAAEYRAEMAHAGGSPDGLLLLNSLRMPNIEGLKGKTARYFFRYGGSGVHNLFTNSVLLSAALKQARYDRYKPTYRAWVFKDEAKRADRPKKGTGVTIDLGAGAAFAVRYTYDRATNSYLRFTGGRAHVDRNTKKQIRVKNVVLLFVPKEKVLDKKGRLELKTIGSGKGVLLQDGRATTISWKKSTTYGRTILTTSNKKEVQFNRGSIWIEVVPAGHPYALVK